MAIAARRWYQTLFRQFATVYLMLLMATSVSNAEGLSEIDAANELSAEMAECFAYYSIGTACAPVNVQPEVEKAFDNTKEMATQRIYEYGKIAGLSDKALMSRVELAMKSLIRETENKCVNFAVLLNKYAEQCKASMESPQQRLEHLKKFGTGE